MSKLDAASGFFQIPLKEESRDYTTFLTPFGRYRFKRLPMGIDVAPEIYQRKMCELLAGIDDVLVYMDDVRVYGRSKAEHDNTLREVLNRVRNAGLKLDKEKCHFNQTKLKFLGHIIMDNGIEISSNKIDSILKLKTPCNIRELRTVLGLVNFVTKFIRKAQTNLTPFNELLKKGVCWQRGQRSTVGL